MNKMNKIDKNFRDNVKFYTKMVNGKCHTMSKPVQTEATILSNKHRIWEKLYDEMGMPSTEDILQTLAILDEFRQNPTATCEEIALAVEYYLAH